MSARLTSGGTGSNPGQERDRLLPASSEPVAGVGPGQQSTIGGPGDRTAERSVRRSVICCLDDRKQRRCRPPTSMRIQTDSSLRSPGVQASLIANLVVTEMTLARTSSVDIDHSPVRHRCAKRSTCNSSSRLLSEREPSSHATVTFYEAVANGVSAPRTTSRSSLPRRLLEQRSGEPSRRCLSRIALCICREGTTG